MGTIANSTTKEFSVSPGQHSISTKIDWGSSRTQSFDISGNEMKMFEVGAFRHSKWLMPTTMFVVVLSYIIKLKYDFVYLYYLPLPIFLLLVYYFTLGRKRYLNLTEANSQQEENSSVLTEVPSQH